MSEIIIDSLLSQILDRGSASPETVRELVRGYRIAKQAGYLLGGSSVQCPHCHWGFFPSVIEQHIREKHGDAV